MASPGSGTLGFGFALMEMRQLIGARRDVVDPESAILVEVRPQADEGGRRLVPFVLRAGHHRGRIVRPFDRRVRRPVEHDLADDGPPVAADANLGRATRPDFDGFPPQTKCCENRP